MPTGRFAPSPSGPLHLGNLRTALLAWLFARSEGGRFLLRIEDLDRGRSPPRARAGADRRSARDRARLGRPRGPTVRAHGALPRRAGAARERRPRLPCWCTRAEIRAAGEAPHGPLPEGAYPGTCRGLDASERAERERSGRPAALRLDAGSAEIAFHDRLHGDLSGAVDDFVLWRGDDTPAYQLAVVVDDADQGVDEVVRGDDLLDSAPRQLLLARLLGLPAPAYAHVPLVLGPDGQRLAKRHGAVTLADRAALGETPADALAWMAASLGLAQSGERPTAADLIARFDPAALPREPTVYVTSA